MGGGRDRRPLLELAWRTLVRCQFHDAIAGCASDDVGRAVDARLTSVEALAREVVRGSVLDLVRHDPDAVRDRATDPQHALVLWNPAARPRGGVAVADVTLFRRDVIVGAPSGRKPRQGEGYRPFALRAPDGHAVPVQVLDRRPDLERLDATRHYPHQDEVDRVRIAFRAPPMSGLGLATLGPAPAERLSLVAALEARQALRGGRVGVRFVAMLHADSPAVRCVLEIDNRATHHRLRARLPTGLKGRAAVAGAAFGTVARPPVLARSADYPLETPARTAPAQRFVAAAEGRRGLALLAPGFFEYEWTPAGDLVLTLLRAAGELSRGDLPTRPGHAGWPTPTPLAQCPGPCRIELAVAPVSQADVEQGDMLAALWEDVFLPLRGFWLRDAAALAPAPAEVAARGTGLVVSSVKPAQAGSPVVLRCYNARSEEHTSELQSL